MKLSIPFPDSLKKISKHRQFLYGFAALWIMFFHMGTKFPNHGIGKPIYYFQTTGAAGVEMFLLLTGFGLYGSMKKAPRLGSFYGKRFARVFLPSFIALAIMSVFIPLGLKEYLGSLTFFAHWFGIDTVWYVAFILTMYLIYPLIFALTNKKRWVLYIIAVFFWGLTFALSSLIGKSHESLLRMISRIPSFLVGCALAPHFEKDRRLPKRVLLFSVILTIPFMLLYKMAPASESNHPIRSVAYFFYAIDLIIVLSMIAEMLSRKGIGRILYRCFAFCGQVSLEIYLIFSRLHFLLSELPAFKAYPHSNVRLDIAAAICTVILAVVLQNIAKSITKTYADLRIPEPEMHLESSSGKNSKIQ